MAFVMDENDEEVNNKLFPILVAYFSGMRETFKSGDIYTLNPQAPKRLLEAIAKTIVESRFKEQELLMSAATAILVSDERQLFHGVDSVDVFIEAEKLLFNLKFLSQEDLYDWRGNHIKMLSKYGEAIEKKFQDMLETHGEVKKLSQQSLSFLTAFIVDVLYECIVSGVNYEEYLQHRGIEAI